MESFLGSNKDAIMQDLEAQVERNLRLFLDPKIGREYAEAVLHAPDLVQRETRVADFLRREDYHTLRACHRIALYWKTRKELFGAERWLRPMTQTAQGALSSDQVRLLRSGFLSIVTSPQLVCIADVSRLPDGVPYVDPCIVFYLNTIFAGLEGAATEGFIMFYIVQSASSRVVPVEKIRSDVVGKIMSSVAFKIKKAIIARAFEPGREHLFEYLAFHQQRHYEINYRLGTQNIMGDSLRHTLDLLEENGLDRSCIPVALGGDYFYSQFDNFIRTRLSCEDASMMAAAPPIWNSATANNVVARIPKAGSRMPQPPASHGEHSHPDQHYSEDPRKANSREADILVVRREDESPEDFEKRRHSVYGKRSYQKKQRNNEDLMEQRHRLEGLNAVLRKDNRRLETLMLQARLTVATYLDGCRETLVELD